MAFENKKTTHVSEALKEINGDHKFSRCPYFQDSSFEVLNSVIALDKVNLECEELLKLNLPEMIQFLLTTQVQ